MRRLVLLGNHMVNYSTEAHHAWTWERLGWQVTRLQEHKATTDDILKACEGAQALQITHTHGWFTVGSFQPEQLLERVRAMGVPSFSYHLDLYFGLSVLDKRAERVGQHWSWKVDHFFSTDGGHENEYKACGVHHHYLPAGCVEYGSYIGNYQASFASNVGFVGSVSYHPEYPFRTKLVEELRKKYTTSFRTYAGLREKPLNDAYASIKVVVGDHCFAGIPLYASDRLFETTGRGGFLIYPETQGVTDQIPGLVTYKPQNLDDLYTKIDYFLDPAHESERIERRNTAHEWVKKNATYTQRLQEILRVMGLE